MSAGGEDVCVIIAAFRARDTIGRAVRTALAQSEVREVIVVDDASPDDTANAARSADDHSGRLRIIALTHNVGPGSARNRALEVSTSPCFCVLDADDFLLPGRFGRLLALGPLDWDLLADDIMIVPESAKSVDLACPNAGTAPPIHLNLVSFINGNIPHPHRPRGELGFLKPIIKRAFLERHGLLYDETLRLGEDYALYAKALAHGARFQVVGACGYVAVERRVSLSSTHSTQDLRRLLEFDDRCLAELCGLSPSERTAFAAHRASTLRRYQYRAILDCKRDRGMLRAIGALVRIPHAIPHVAAQTARARLARLGWPLDRANAKTERRLLIGVSPPLRSPQNPPSR